MFSWEKLKHAEKQTFQGKHWSFTRINTSLKPFLAVKKQNKNKQPKQNNNSKKFDMKPSPSPFFSGGGRSSEKNGIPRVVK